jgi:hypothetical protein
VSHATEGPRAVKCRLHEDPGIGLLGARFFVHDRLGALDVAPYPARSLSCVLALGLWACGGPGTPAPGVSSGPKPRPSDAQDGGAGGAAAAISPRPDGGAILPPADEEIELPFQGPAVLRTLELAAAPRVLDLHISVDTTASMNHEIDELQRSLRTQLIPMLRARVPEVSFGASRFEDFPGSPFGNQAAGGGRDDQPFALLSAITSDEERVATAIANLDQPLGMGGDLPESGFEALFQIATGQGYRLGNKALIDSYVRKAEVGGGLLGGVGFREGALRAVLHVTDAPSHTPSEYAPLFPGTHDLQAAADALIAINAKLIGLVSECGKRVSCDPDSTAAAREQLERLAIMTGAIGTTQDDGCPYGVNGRVLPAVDDGCPLVFDVAPDGTGLSNTLIDSVAALLDGTRFRVVSALATDDPIGFVQRIEPIAPELEPDQPPPETADLLPEAEPDGQTDSFVTVAAHTPIAFELELRNLTIASSDTAQRFRIAIEVRGDGTVLERRTFRIVIPQGDRLAPIRDAGGGDADGG